MDTRSPHLPPIIAEKLRSLRRSLRSYVALDGLATTVAAVVGLFWLDLALDRFFEFSRPFRGLLLVGLIAVTIYVIWLRIVRRLRIRFGDGQLARVFEHFEPSLDESLITAVELDATDRSADPVLLQQTRRRAADELENVEIRRFFRYGRLLGRWSMAALLLAAMFVFCVRFAETAELWFSRNMLLSERDWPRRSRLVVEGFQDGRIRIGRGDSFTLTVRADTAMPLVPETVRLRLGTRESGFRTVLVDQFRVDTLDGVEWRTFSHTFAEMLETLPLSVRGADTTLDGLEIEVVPPPMLTNIELRQIFPDYMQRPDRTASPGNRMTVSDGTSLEITAETNKPLKKAGVVLDRGDVQSLDDGSAAPFSTIRYRLESLRKDTRLEFQLEDIDSLRNRQPIRLDFTVLRDQPPTVTARLDGIGSAVTPSATLPTLGELTDDYGLAAAVFRYSIERAASEENGEKTEPKADDGTAEITGIGAAQTIFPLDEQFSVTACDVKPGDKLSLWLEATDRFDLDDSGGQTGSGQRWTLEIVTPERLRSLLEVREISLRQRFEVLIGEVELTRELVDGIELTAPETLVQEAEALTIETGDDEAETRRRQEELETRRKTLLETISKEQAEPARYNLSRALRDTQKEVYEIRTIIESFRLIRREMVNNGIFSEDSETRLDRGIIEPMQGLVDVDFPDTDQLLKLLDEVLLQLDQPLRTTAIDRRRETLERFDQLLKRMTTIRDNMVSMESFNEVIEILRAVLRQQQQLRQETIEEKNRRLKNLLE